LTDCRKTNQGFAGNANKAPQFGVGVHRTKRSRLASGWDERVVADAVVGSEAAQKAKAIV
jgi:hypothetical protein